jgi:sialate O-acetylesterase
MAKKHIVYAGIALLLTATLAQAEPRLPRVFGDNMVLQRDMKVPVWGWAEPGEKFTVEFAGRTIQAEADNAGEWSVRLASMKAHAEPRDLKIGNLTFTNVLVGDVWLCSGQSNMEFRFGGKGEEYKNDLVHLFRVEGHTRAPYPLPDVTGKWSDYRDGRDNSFSGVGLFFGCKLQKELGIPIGLIDSSWGGTAIEPWISDEGYELLGKPVKSDITKVMEQQDRIVKDVKTWLAQVEAYRPAKKPIPFAVDTRLTGSAPNQIYNGMVAGMVPFGIKGVIWYQGESNRGRKYPDYFNKLHGLITGWRKAFKVPDAPFYLVQIAPYDYNRGNRKANDTTLCDNIWAAQYKAAEEISNCGIIPTHDTIKGNVKDIHPRDKKPVGERLAALAMKETYGKKVVCSGPVFKSAEVKDDKVVVRFDRINEGLETTNGEAPTWFELSGDGVKWVSADAEINDEAVQVSSPDLETPKFVRMGWSEIAIPNLRDGNGWPAFQFGPKPVE